ncbi:MAG: hypothetical protein WAO76_14705 [Georgfuchsia sp.]
MRKSSGEISCRDNSRFARALAVSLLFHALVLMVHIGIPRPDSPGLDAPGQQRSAGANPLHVVLAAPSSRPAVAAKPSRAPLRHAPAKPLPSPRRNSPPMTARSGVAAKPVKQPESVAMNTRVLAVASALEAVRKKGQKPDKTVASPINHAARVKAHPNIIVQKNPIRETFTVPKPVPEGTADVARQGTREATRTQDRRPKRPKQNNNAVMASTAAETASRRAAKAAVRLAHKQEQRLKEAVRRAKQAEKRRIARKQKEQRLAAARLLAQQEREARRQAAMRQAQEAEERRRIEQQEAARQLAAAAEARKQAEDEVRRMAEEMDRQQMALMEKQLSEQLSAAELAAQQAQEIVQEEALRQAQAAEALRIEQEQQEQEALRLAAEAESRQRLEEQQVVLQLAAETEAREQAVLEASIMAAELVRQEVSMLESQQEAALQQALAAQALRADEEAGLRQATEAAALAQAEKSARQQALVLEASRSAEAGGGERNDVGTQAPSGTGMSGTQLASREGAAAGARSADDNHGPGENGSTNPAGSGSGGQANASATTGSGSASGAGPGSKPAKGDAGSGHGNDEIRVPNRKEGSRPGGQTVVAGNSQRRGTLLGGYLPDVEVVIFAEVWRRNINSNAPFSLLQKAKAEDYKNPWVTVALRSDGSVENIRFDHSSGVTAIDVAVRQTIMLLSPYDPFPPELAAEYDVIDIPSIWTFNNALRLIWGGG